MEMEKGLNGRISSGQEKQPALDNGHSKASPSNESSGILEENRYKSTGAGRQKSEAGCVLNGQEEEALQRSNRLSKGSLDDKDALIEKLNNIKTGEQKKSRRESGERRESISARIQQTVSRRFGQQRLFGVHSEPSSFGTESSSSSVEAVDDLLPDTIADSPTKETQRGQIGSPTAEAQPARRLSKVQSNILLKQATQAAASVAAATSTTSSAYPQYRGGDPSMVPVGAHHRQPHPNLPPSNGMPGYWSSNSPSGVRTPPSSGNSSMSSRTNSTCTNSTNTTNNDTMSLPPNFRVGQHNSRFRRAQQMTKVQDLKQEPTISLINVGRIPNGDLARFFEKRQSQLSIGTFSASTLQCTSSEESSDGFPRAGSTASLPPTSKHSHDILPIDEQGGNLYHRTLHSLSNDIVYQKEIALGKRIGFYRLGKELGAGNFSKVKLGVHVLTKEKVAVKMMEKTKMDQKAQRLLLREIDNMELMHHPNIIRLFEAVETLSKIYLVMEYAGGGELYTYVHDNGKLTEEVAKPIFAQLVSAVAHLHSKEITHRDIKAENVIFSQPGWVKLADFGFSCKFEDGTRLNTFCGSPPYAAPELFRDTNYDGAMVDIWALGVLLYFMLIGVTPFRGESVHDLKRNILEGGYYMPEYVSTFAQHIISRMLEMDSYKRANITELKRTYWLKDTKFPDSYLQLSLTPDEKELENNEIERFVWDTLHSYGIDEEMIREAAGKGARNSIIGTYRIVLYQCQAKERNEERQKIHDNLMLLAERNRYLAAKMKQQSKTCAII